MIFFSSFVNIKVKLCLVRSHTLEVKNLEVMDIAMLTMDTVMMLQI